MRVNMIAPAFVKTAIISPEVQETLTKGGMPWATAEDAAKAVLHISSDANINGRTLAIVPRVVSEDGYLDLCEDDFNDGERLTEWQRAYGGVAQWDSLN